MISIKIQVLQLMNLLIIVYPSRGRLDQSVRRSCMVRIKQLITDEPALRRNTYYKFIELLKLLFYIKFYQKTK